MYMYKSRLVGFISGATFDMKSPPPLDFGTRHLSLLEQNPEVNSGLDTVHVHTVVLLKIWHL